MGINVGLAVRSTPSGRGDAVVGVYVGEPVGPGVVGCTVGMDEGELVGWPVGPLEGTVVGVAVGREVGCPEGKLLGWLEG